MGALELFLNQESYSKHPVLTDLYNNDKTVLGENLFCSYESVFELASGLRDSQASINKKDLGLLVKKEAENVCKENFWSFFWCVFALSYVICRTIYLFHASCGFQMYQKMLNQKTYPKVM